MYNNTMFTRVHADKLYSENIIIFSLTAPEYIRGEKNSHKYCRGEAAKFRVGGILRVRRITEDQQGRPPSLVSKSLHNDPWKLTTNLLARDQYISIR